MVELIKIDNETSADNLNDIIKRYLILILADNTENSVDRTETNALLTDKKIMIPLVARKFKLITDETIEKELNSLESLNKRWFWKILCRFNCLNQVSCKKVQELLQNSSVNVVHLLENYKTVEAYGSVIKDYLIDNPRYAQLLICEYLRESEENRLHYHFPKELSMNDKTDMVIRYINSDFATPNILHLLCESNGNDQLQISAKIQVMAEERYNSIVDEILKNAAVCSNSVSISFKKQDVSVLESFKDMDVYYSYDEKWILNNMDYPTLFNNFIYLFEFVDTHCRWQHISKGTMRDTLEKAMTLSAKRCYKHSLFHSTIETKAKCQMLGYYNILKDKAIYLEDMILWFFEQYLPQEFNVKGFIFKKPSCGSNILERCTRIAVEIEGILKQYKMYCDDGEINRKLLERNKDPMKISCIPSILGEYKYACPTSSKVGRIFYLLFSDQSMMLYQPKKNEEYFIPYEVLKRDKIFYSELERYQQDDINFLIEQGILRVDSTSLIIFSHKLLDLLYDLYLNEFICLRYLDSYATELDFLKEKGLVRFEKTLLSTPEQNYYDYILNNASFDNSLALRNKYAHASYSLEESIMFDDYITMLRLFVLIIIKINEEFCLKELIKNK